MKNDRHMRTRKKKEMVMKMRRIRSRMITSLERTSGIKKNTRQ